jgi:FMN reductase
MLVMRVPNHALAVDLQLRPLLLELGASTPAPGLAFLEPDLAEPGPVLDSWAARVAAALGRCAALAAPGEPTPDSATTTAPGRSPATVLAT